MSEKKRALMTSTQKAKVALEAVKGGKTVNEIAQEYSRVYAQLVSAGGLPPLGLFVDESTNCLHDGSIN